MDGLDFLMENLRPFSPFLGYAVVRVVEVATSLWTWMTLVLIILLSLWGFKGIKGFQICFSWWGKQAKVRVMLQSSSSSSASNHTAAKKNNTAFADDNLSLCRNMCMDDFHVFTYRGGGLTGRDIRTRRFNNRSKSSSTIDSLTLCKSAEAMDSYVEAGSACFLQTKMLFIIEKSSSLSVAKSVSSPLRFGKKELKSPTSDQQLVCWPRSLIRLPKHEKLYPADEFGGNERRSIDDPMQYCRGKTTFTPEYLYDVECKEKCKGSLFVMNDGGGRQLGACMSDNCLDLGLWRRLASFEIQSGWDRLQSLKLGYALNWNRCTRRSGLSLNQFSKYLLRDINVAKVLDIPKRSLVKLFSLQEDAVSSVDSVWNMGISSTCTVSDNSSVIRLWDIEVGKCLDKMVVDDYAIVGSHIQNSHGFLFSGIMIREEKSSLFLWDPRDFLKPLNFSVGNMLAFHSLQFTDNKVSLSDCFNETMFDLRMIVGSSYD